MSNTRSTYLRPQVSMQQASLLARTGTFMIGPKALLLMDV